MQTSDHLPTMGRAGAFGHNYRDELKRGDKRRNRRVVRQAEEARWRKEAREEADAPE